MEKALTAAIYLLSITAIIALLLLAVTAYRMPPLLVISRNGALVTPP